MRSMRPSAIALVVLATAAVIACNGKLKVGEKPATTGAAGEPGDEPASSGGTAGIQGSGGAPAGAGGRAAGAGAASAAGASAGGAAAAGATAAGGRESGGGRGGAPGASGVGPLAGTGSAAAGAGVSGSASSGGGVPGSWVDDATPVPAAPGSSEGCPIGPIPPDTACDTEGLTCGYFYELEQEHDYQECACTRTRGDGFAWKCYLNWGGQITSCPGEAPEDGTDCFGYFGLTCRFPPRVTCQCDDSLEEPAWICPTLEVPEHLNPPSSPEPIRPIADLGDEEREAWCQWFATAAAGGPGSPAVADRPVDDDGYTSGSSCHYGDTQFCQATVPALSKAQCVANLKLSECGSPISNLTACVRDVFGDVCGPFDYGCLDYFETPSCGGTIAIDAAGPTSPSPTCGVRVE